MMFFNNENNDIYLAQKNCPMRTLGTKYIDSLPHLMLYNDTQA